MTSALFLLFERPSEIDAAEAACRSHSNHWGINETSVLNLWPYGPGGAMMHKTIVPAIDNARIVIAAWGDKPRLMGICTLSLEQLLDRASDRVGCLGFHDNGQPLAPAQAPNLQAPCPYPKGTNDG